MKVTIDRINRTPTTTQYGETERIGLKIKEAKVTDVNDRDIEVGERWLNGYRDKRNPVTDKWEEGMTVSIFITENEGTNKAGEKTMYLNFKANSEVEPEISVPTGDEF